MKNSQATAEPPFLSLEARANPAGSTSGNGHGRPRIPNFSLPEAQLLTDLIDVDNPAVACGILRDSLLNPLAEMSANPGKCIRGQLVQLVYRLFADPETVADAATKQVTICADVVELIHAGSLVVDDIEDGSRMRRGRPALHVRHGLPLALNAGNWLYFWPYELIRGSKFSDRQALDLYERCHRTLLRAHFGQAIDLGSRVDQLAQECVADACKASLQLKTGALMGWAAVLGATIAAVPRAIVDVADRFGRDLGVALQMFDDLGNLLGRCEPSKQHEDLFLARPSWVWACAARHASRSDYEKFLRAVRQLPDAANLQQWIIDHDLDTLIRQSAQDHLNRSYQRLYAELTRLEFAWSEPALSELRSLGDDIAKAYG